MKISKVFFLFVLFPLIANIRTIESLRELEHEFSQLDQKALVVFDIDEVLLTAVDQALKTPHKELFRKIADELVALAKTDEQKRLLEYRLSLTYLYPNRILVEKNSVPIITRLQDQGVYVMGITRCRRGRFGIIPKVEQWRKELLCKNGINFNRGMIQGLDCELTSFGHEESNVPLLEEGLLFGRKIPKDQLIHQLIQTLSLSIERIYLIDDERSNLDSIASLQSYEVHPIEYVGARSMLMEISKRKVKWQISKLLETGQWFEDEAIEEMGVFGGLIRYSIPSFLDLIF
ncbi:MAG: DUF2608 domain-containing protein [Verrucomicrobia bacterium]|nr:DUF2608 domain-containing protein [Verrucomicrobiota bacterium]NDE63558.1 DUF2608 domain-containing protein [Chlamydiota bacterium]